MNHLLIKEQEIPIRYKSELVVIGGGPSGVAAAVSASSLGVKTIIVERNGFLGGQATGGLVIYLPNVKDGKKVLVKGFCKKVINDLEKLESCYYTGNNIVFDPESMKWLFDKYINKQNIKPLYHSIVVDAVKEDNKISHIIVESKSGRFAIDGKFFIDASGDADIAGWLNLPFELLNKNKLLPVTLSFRMGNVDVDKAKSYIDNNNYKVNQMFNTIEEVDILPQGFIKTMNESEAWFDVLYIKNVDSTEVEDLTYAEIKGRDVVRNIFKIFQNIPGFENSYLIDTASQLGIRESRRITGEYYLEKKDEDIVFPDEIFKVPNGYSVSKKLCSIPYRCLIPKNVDNLLMAGRCISVSHEMLDLIREIPWCFSSGAAAGVASYLAISNNKKARNIDTAKLQEYLKNKRGLKDNETELKI